MSSPSSVSSSSAVRRPRLRVVLRFGCSGAVAEDEIKVEVEVEVDDVPVGAEVFVRVLRCLLVDCFALLFVLVLVLAVVTLVVRDEEDGWGSEPIVAVVETLLNEEYVDVSLVVDLVDPMVAIVEVLRSVDGFGTLLDTEVEVMESSMLAMA
jgi:hypothetical protein